MAINAVQFTSPLNILLHLHWINASDTCYRVPKPYNSWSQPASPLRTCCVLLGRLADANQARVHTAAAANSRNFYHANPVLKDTSTLVLNALDFPPAWLVPR